MEKANFIASLSVQKEGTQTSYPTKDQLNSNLWD